MEHPILVTGAAGFVGFHLAQRLLEDGRQVVGADNVNAYYSVALKHARVRELERYPGFSFRRLELADAGETRALFDSPYAAVVHLAAQAGVRYSLTSPQTYIDSNITGLLNVLEGLRRQQIPAIYASSSSVYGDDSAQPFREDAVADAPVSLYAATKRAGELMASSYAHLFGIPVTGVRFFTVYGPWGRPDMAYFRFCEAITAGRPIELYGAGLLQRDFTEVSDVVEALVRLLERPPDGPRPHRVLNVGAGRPVPVTTVVDALECALGVRAIRQEAPMQPGDVAATWADTTALFELTGFRPRVTVEEGTARFVAWFRDVWPSVR